MKPIAYTEDGQGQPVILIHGFCETKEMWENFSRILSPEYRVLCPDLPGFGGSPMDGDSINLVEVAENLMSWMHSIEVENPVVIGHSLGGYVSLALAEKMESRLKGMVLLHSTAFPDDEEKIKARNQTIQLIEKKGVNAYVNNFFPQLFPEHRRKELREEIERSVSFGKKTSKESLVAYIQAMRDRNDRTSVLENFSGKKAMIAGELDSIINIKESRRHRHMVDLYFELKQTGHMGMVESESETLDYLRNFCLKE